MFEKLLFDLAYRSKLLTVFSLLWNHKHL